MSDTTNQVLNLMTFIRKSKEQLNSLKKEKQINLSLILNDKNICFNDVVKLGDFKSLSSNKPDHILLIDEKKKMIDAFELQYSKLEEFYNYKIKLQLEYNNRVKEIYEKSKLGYIYNLSEELISYNIF